MEWNAAVSGHHQCIQFMERIHEIYNERTGNIIRFPGQFRVHLIICVAQQFFHAVRSGPEMICKVIVK